MWARLCLKLFGCVCVCVFAFVVLFGAGLRLFRFVCVCSGDCLRLPLYAFAVCVHVLRRCECLDVLVLLYVSLCVFGV